MISLRVCYKTKTKTKMTNSLGIECEIHRGITTTFENVLAVHIAYTIDYNNLKLLFKKKNKLYSIWLQ